MALRHHELCFGCGRTNLFGLLAELEADAPGQLSGRCFVKQDHQGPTGTTAHPGIVAAALIEAMSLCCGPTASPSRLELDFGDAVAVGEFLELQAAVAETGRGIIQVSATAGSEGRIVASAMGSFVRGP